MLEINIKRDDEFFNSLTNEFVKISPTIVKLEHSLISISKWEAIWGVPYLPTVGKVKGISTPKEYQSYIKCMIIGSVDHLIPDFLYQQHLTTIKKYIEDPHSATTIQRRGPQIPNRNIITSEVVYYWMFKYNISIECEKWHFNRLLKLLEVCSIKETPPKKNRMSRQESVNEIYKLNEARRALMNK